MWVYCENRLLKFDENGGAKRLRVAATGVVAHLLDGIVCGAQRDSLAPGVARGRLLTYDGNSYQMVNGIGTGACIRGIGGRAGGHVDSDAGRGAFAVAAGGSRGVSPTPLVERVAVDDVVQAEYGGLLPTGKATDLSVEDAVLKLPPDHFKVEFDFTSLDFAAPENVRFRYKLEGFDQELD